MPDSFEKEIILKIKDRTRNALKKIKGDTDKNTKAQKAYNRESGRGGLLAYKATMRQKRALVSLRRSMRQARSSAKALWKQFKVPIMAAVAAVGASLAAGFGLAINRAKELRGLVADTKLAGEDNTEQGRERLFRFTKFIEALSGGKFEGGTEEVAKIAGEFSKRVAEASGNEDTNVGFSQEKADFFKSVGLDPNKLIDLSPLERLDVALQAINNLKNIDPTKFNSFADTIDNLFGGGEQETLAAVYNSSIEEINRARKSATDAYFSATDQQIENANKLSAAQAKLSAQFGELRNKIADALIPVIIPLVDGLAAFLNAINAVIDWVSSRFGIDKKTSNTGTPFKSGPDDGTRPTSGINIPTVPSGSPEMMVRPGMLRAGQEIDRLIEQNRAIESAASGTESAAVQLGEILAPLLKAQVDLTLRSNHHLAVIAAKPVASVVQSTPRSGAGSTGGEAIAAPQ